MEPGVADIGTPAAPAAPVVPATRPGPLGAPRPATMSAQETTD
jgi:hypothetical protein